MNLPSTSKNLDRDDVVAYLTEVGNYFYDEELNVSEPYKVTNCNGSHARIDISWVL